GAAALATSPMPDSSGHFSTPVTVPFEAPAGYTFYACQACAKSPFEAREPFTVAPPMTPRVLVDPPGAQPGSTITATGTGWNPLNGPVTIFPSQEAVADPTAALVTKDPGPTGNITTSFVAPDTLGALVLFACQLCPNADEFPSATTPLTLQPAPTTPSP